MSRAEMCVVWSAFVVRDSSCYMYSVNCVIWLGKKNYQTTNQQLELHVHTNNSPKEKHLPCYIRDFIIGKWQRPPPLPSTFTYLVRKPLFGPNSGHYTPSQMSTRRIFTGFEQKESIWKNLINWPLNRPFSHLIFVTFSLNGTLSHVAVMAVT